MHVYMCMYIYISLQFISAIYYIVRTIKIKMVSRHQWRSYTGAHWGTGPTISFCGPTINILTDHVYGVHSYTYSYTLFILIYKL